MKTLILRNGYAPAYGLPEYSGAVHAIMIEDEPDTVQDSPVIRALDDPLTSSIIKFDLSPIPQNSVVSEAYLLYRPTSSGQNQDVAVAFHRIIAEWEPSEVTWNSRASGVAWGTPGAKSIGTDVDQATIVEFETTIGEVYEIPLPANIVTDLNTWLSGTEENRGWVIHHTGIGDVVGRGVWGDVGAERLALKVVYDNDNLELVTEPITDSEGLPVAGATAYAVDVGSGTRSGSAITDFSGVARIGVPVPGQYLVTARGTNGHTSQGKVYTVVEA